MWHKMCSPAFRGYHYRGEKDVERLIMGNFPQAFTPLAVITAALNLERALASH